MIDEDDFEIDESMYQEWTENEYEDEDRIADYIFSDDEGDDLEW